MTTKEKVARRKLSLLELARELDNVSRACKVMGYSRQQFYEIWRNFQTYGADGLIDRLPGAKGPHPNRVPAEIEAAILDHALDHPCHGALRVEQELRLKGIQVSSGGVRGVWQRHGLLTKHERLLRLEKATAERKLALSDEQIRLLERFSPEFRERHIEAPHTGALVAVDTFFVGTLKGVGKIYLQTAIDCHSRHAWARLYTNKLPVTAVHLQLAEQVERLRLHISAALPDDADAKDALKHIREAASTLDDAADRIITAADEIKAAVPATADHSEAVNKAYFSIIEACSFHDLTCQRLTKVRKTIESMTDGLGKIRPFVTSSAEVPPAPEPVEPEPIDEDAALLNGPAHEFEGLSQDEIDKMLEL